MIIVTEYAALRISNQKHINFVIGAMIGENEGKNNIAMMLCVILH